MTEFDHSKPQWTVAVVGLGLLGRGIATCFLGHGLRVVGCDHSAEVRISAREYIGHGIHELVQHAGFNAQALADWSQRYHEAGSFDGWPECDFVVESVVEELAAKHAVFDAIERCVRPAVPIASNTSTIPISDLQQGRKHPERFLGMHWFEPAHATRFLELVPGEHTAPEAMNTAIAIAKRCGKDPSVLAKDIPGFIVNRLGYAMYREALNLLELGIADADTIDRTFRNVFGVWSTVFGPFQWIDLTGGPALYGPCLERMLPTLSDTATLPAPMRQLVTEGAHGVTDGRGFYRYSPADARQAMERFHAHAWRARQLMNEYFPLPEGPHAAVD